jgi:hypothetical protein
VIFQEIRIGHVKIPDALPAQLSKVFDSQNVQSIQVVALKGRVWVKNTPDASFFIKLK